MSGSIRRRGKNTWELTIDQGRDAKGKRVRKFVNVRGKKADAERKLREILNGLDSALPMDTSRMRIWDDLEKKYTTIRMIYRLGALT